VRVHPLLALFIAMAVATLILGAITAIASLRNVPEAYEDDDGFWSVEENEEIAEPARVRVVARERLREQPADSEIRWF
jgi:hypothetical protein